MSARDFGSADNVELMLRCVLARLLGFNAEGSDDIIVRYRNVKQVTVMKDSETIKGLNRFFRLHNVLRKSFVPTILSILGNVCHFSSLEEQVGTTGDLQFSMVQRPIILQSFPGSFPQFQTSHILDSMMVSLNI